MEEFNYTTIHKSLHKPNLFFGAEREPILFSGLIPIALTFSAFHIVMAAVGIVFWVIAGFFLRAIAKKDPMLTKLWIRFINHKQFYPAKTTIWWQASKPLKY